MKNFEEFENYKVNKSELTPEYAQWLISMINKDQSGELSNYPNKQEMFKEIIDVIDKFKI
jgi:hypothetical protein